MNENNGLNYLITGCNGQLGRELIETIGNPSGGDQITPVDIYDYDLEKEDEIEQMFQDAKPDVIVHCAAYTDVEGAEENEKKCMKINHEATKLIVDRAIEINIQKMLYVSTNYVFDGLRENPYTEMDQPRPFGVYATSKYLGEQEVRRLAQKAIIVRSSAIFGLGSGRINNFVDKILNFARNTRKEEIKIINDEFINPTYSADLAHAIKIILSHHNLQGVFHVVNSGEANWCDFAKHVVDYCKLDKKIIPISSSEYECKAPRPKNGLLVGQRLKHYCGLELRSWQSALEDYLYSIGSIKEDKELLNG